MKSPKRVCISFTDCKDIDYLCPTCNGFLKKGKDCNKCKQKIYWRDKK